MVERIRELLQARQLSPTQFADTIGVARPIVSHILGGRNKPSLEVVQKIIAAFPDVALPWLLAGQGAMLANNGQSLAASPPVEASTAPAAAPALAEGSLDRPRTRKRTEQPDAGISAPLGAAVTAAEMQHRPEAVIPGGAEPPAPPHQPSPAVTLPESPVAVPMAATAPAELPILPAGDKAIRRVVVFYQDGTFSDYRPSDVPL